MSVPDKNHPCWGRLATGVPGFSPRALALQLLFTRLKREAFAPGAQAETLHAFFVKYEKILGSEIAQLHSLKLV